ncbi:MAG: imidazoleglycerol-phosphate dehydratase HisB [Clostridiales bacterium]|nr:imidazoleglycerol-phosphate dehydratase HisB [Clostridiales bacterium]
MRRVSEVVRKTGETDILLRLNLDGEGKSEIASGCGFLDHMLTLFAKHANYDLTVRCKGDVQVDYHHTTEDIGIALGKAFAEALGEKRGITRYGDIILPMDETLIMVATDLSGRDYASIDLQFAFEKVGDFDCELCEEFWLAFVREAKITLHVKQLAGKNAHHIIEGTFKAVARALAKATAIDMMRAHQIPSTKGIL